MKKRVNFKRSIASIAIATAMCSGFSFAEQVGFSTQNGGTTGGAGGAVVTAKTGTEIHAAICNRAADDTPLIIHVEGVINHSNTFKQSGSCNTADGVIELKEISNISKKNKFIFNNKLDKLTRKQFATLLDLIVNPFILRDVNHFGEYVNQK